MDFRISSIFIFFFFQLIDLHAQNLIPFRKGAQWGFIDPNGNWVIQPKFQDADAFHEGHAAVKLGGHWGLIKMNGDWAIRPLYTAKYVMILGASRFNFRPKGGFVMTESDGKKAFLSYDGDTLRKSFDFDDAFPFSEGLAVVRIQENWGAIDTAGEFIIPPSFEKTAKKFSQGLLAYQEGLFWGFIDKTGKSVIAPQYENSYFIEYGFRENLALVKKNSWQFIDKKGFALLNIKYNAQKPFSEGLAAIQNTEGKWGFLDANNTVKISFQFQATSEFKEGLCAVKKDNQVGFINKMGEWVIKPQYEVVDDFSQGLARVKKAGKEFYIDKFGKEYFTAD